MPKLVLSPAEIRQLCAVMREVLTYLRGLREREPLARYIKLPQIPPELSESLAFYLLNTRRLIPALQAYGFQRGGGADITARRSGLMRKIEVKATADKGWQRMRKRDVAADYLIWLHFGNLFLDHRMNSIKVFVIPSPGRYYRMYEDANVRDIPSKAGSAFATARVMLENLGSTGN